MCLVYRLHLGNPLRPALIPKLHFPESFTLCVSLFASSFAVPRHLEGGSGAEAITLGRRVLLYTWEEEWSTVASYKRLDPAADQTFRMNLSSLQP